MVKFRLKHLRIELLKTFGILDKSICLKCEQHLYDGKDRCNLYLHRSKDYVHGGYNNNYDLCEVHNNDGNCPFFEDKFKE